MDLDQLLDEADPTLGVVFEVPAVEKVIGSQRSSLHQPTLRRSSRRVAWAWLCIVVVLVVGLVIGVREASTSKPTVVTPVSVPASWQKVTFGGLTMYAPGNWTTVTEGAWGSCGFGNQPFRVSSVVLNTGLQSFNVECPITPESLTRPVYGLLIDPGQYGPLSDVNGFAACQRINALSVCPTSTSK